LDLFDDNFEQVKGKITSSTNLIFYKDSFSKIKAVNKIIESFDTPVIYLDLDLLFSGYIESGQITNAQNLKVIRPNIGNLKHLLPKILNKISIQKFLVVLDSLNGLYSFTKGDSPGRFVNSLIMLISANLKYSQSILLVTCLAQKKENTWIMPTGKHILESENVNRFLISESNEKIKFEVV